MQFLHCLVVVAGLPFPLRTQARSTVAASTASIIDTAWCLTVAASELFMTLPSLAAIAALRVVEEHKYQGLPLEHHSAQGCRE
jgi:hypothetical protein